MSADQTLVRQNAELAGADMPTRSNKHYIRPKDEAGTSVRACGSFLQSVHTCCWPAPQPCVCRVLARTGSLDASSPPSTRATPVAMALLHEMWKEMPGCTRTYLLLSVATTSAVVRASHSRASRAFMASKAP